MIGAVVAWSLRNRLLVALGATVLAAIGVRAWLTLPIDAVPDISNVQVQVLTRAPGYSPLEVEALVTRPVELAMAGLPGTELVRSVSRSGISAVTIIFSDDVELAAARNLVSQRLPAAREAVPTAADRPELGPLSTGLGEVYHFTVAWPGHDAAAIRTLFDWEIAYALRSVPGVVEVNAWGGDTRQVEVRLRTGSLRALAVSPDEVEAALLAGGRNAGGGAIERGDEQVMVRLDGQYRTLDDVAEQVVRTGPGGVPIRVRDVAEVRDGVAPRLAAATANGEGETLYAMAQMVAGGNAHEVVARVRERLAEIGRRLPDGVRVVPLLDRAALVDRVLHTVHKSLLEGGAVVVLVLLLLLGDVRAGLVVATAIPLAMLGAFALMRATGATGNLMSLGAIDFGLVVDGAVVMVEGAVAAMAARRIDARTALEEEGRAVGRPIAFGVFIIGFVYVPVLLLDGVAGKMFRPMAETVLYALGTAFVLSFTWIPALGSLLLRRSAAPGAHDGARDETQHEVRLLRWLRRRYQPIAQHMIERPKLAAAAALALLLVGAGVASRLGAEFVPRLEEGDLVVQIVRPAGVSLAEAVRGTSAIERALRRFPEVVQVASRSGSPDVASDVMGLEMSDVIVTLRPRSEWTTAADREGLVARFEEALRRALPGTGFSFSQPIEMRQQELLGGTKSDVGVQVHGDDLPTLRRIAAELARTFEGVRGAEDVRGEATAGLPVATLRPSPAKMGRLGVRADEVRHAIEHLRTGRAVGTLVDGERRFDVVVRLDEVPAPDVATLALQPITLTAGRTLPLGDLCDIHVEEGPAQISREQARRRVLVEGNVRGRDLGSFVSELQGRLARVQLPPGYYLSYSGQYQHLAHTARRLAIVVPLTLAAIFALLYLSFHALGPALLILLNVPAGAVGGVLALALRGMPLSISAAVGFIALFGVATLNGVVLLAAARRLEAAGHPPSAAARLAAAERLRPVLTTAAVAALGFLPMALARGTGAEVQRPLATVVIGGLATATLLTLVLLPSLYAWWGHWTRSGRGAARVRQHP